LGSVRLAATSAGAAANGRFGNVTTTSAPSPRGRSRNVPPDDCASARAKANSISPPPPWAKRNGETRRCSAAADKGAPESERATLTDGPLSATVTRNSRGGALSRKRRSEKSASRVSISSSCGGGQATGGRSGATLRTTLTPSSRSVTSRSRNTFASTTSTLAGSAVASGLVARSMNRPVISAARRTSLWRRSRARARSGSGPGLCNSSLNAEIAASRLFSALRTFAAP